MTDRPPVSGEPSTRAGQMYWQWLRVTGRITDEDRGYILAIEAEAAQGAAPRHDPSDHDCRGGVPGDRFPLSSMDAAPRAAQNPGHEHVWRCDYCEADNPCGELGEAYVECQRLLIAARSTPAEALDYPTVVERMTEALHDDCRLEWQAIAVADPTRQVTMHGPDAHLGKAHDLVRRLALPWLSPHNREADHE